MKIIADIGSNFRSLLDCIASIEAAAEAGATAVKFQHHSPHDLYGTDDKTPNLPEDWLPHLNKCCHANEVEFMCTFFNPQKLKDHHHLLSTIKIASSDLQYEELLQVARDIAKPVILSTAGQPTAQIEAALNILGDTPVTVMYCHGEYPSKSHNLFYICHFQNTFKKNEIGYSDHSIDICTPAIAHHIFEVDCIEKHFKCFDMVSPDANHSLFPGEFFRMTRLIKANYPEFIQFSDAEQDFYTRYNRRLIATRDIKKDDLLIYKYNYGAFRSTTETYDALSGLCSQQVDGSKVISHIAKGEAICAYHIR